MTPPHQEFVIAVAMLRGAELVDPNASGWWVAKGDGYTTPTYWHKWKAADCWLKHWGIWVERDGSIQDFNTRIEP